MTSSYTVPWLFRRTLDFLWLGSNRKLEACSCENAVMLKWASNYWRSMYRRLLLCWLGACDAGQTVGQGSHTGLGLKLTWLMSSQEERHTHMWEQHCVLTELDDSIIASRRTVHELIVTTWSWKEWQSVKGSMAVPIPRLWALASSTEKTGFWKPIS